ncbi:MAG: phospholipid-binding lipoprotein MlaA [Halioglobus sp.]|jgi:phospholipid-binding lipoprotein MlaA
MAMIRFILTLFLLLPLSFAQGQVLLEEENADPLESINRPLFALNDGLDRLLIKPVAQIYHAVMPDVGERGVGNFFANLYDINTMINALLQWRLEGAVQSGGRFLVNSTAGFLGFIDVATPMGMRPFHTDFGQTLATWGVGSGPYIMVPLFGPRTLRSGAGTMVDLYLAPQVYFVEDTRVRNTLFGAELVDARARLLKAEELMSGDRYIFIRDAYLQQRNFLLNGGVVEDSFLKSEDDGWDEDF